MIIKKLYLIFDSSNLLELAFILINKIIQKIVLIER